MTGQQTVLRERLDQNYKDYMAQLQGKTVDELIALAPEITAAKQCHEELLDACDEDDMTFLLQFDDPLEVVRGYWESEITGYDHSDEMGHMLWEIRDRELYPKEQLAQERFKPLCPLIGQNGNIFNLVGIAAGTLRENGMDAEAKELTERIMGGECHSYEEAIAILTEYVQPTDILTERPQGRNHKKKENAHER